jgi:hypothetical protein
MSRPVVVGVAEKQPNVLTFAVQEARTTQSPLRVVHATGIHPPTAGSFAGGLVVEELRQAGRPVLDDAEHLIHDEAPGLDANFVLTSETPVRALEHTSSGARLLVLGSDEVPWFDGLAHRRISGHMALHAECPVVVVPSDSPTRTTGDLVLTLDGDIAAVVALRPRPGTRSCTSSTSPPPTRPPTRPIRSRRTSARSWPAGGPSSPT